MDKRAMFENRAVEHGTVCFICTPILWNLSTCHMSLCKNSSSASILEKVTRLQKNISLWMADMSSVVKVSDKAELTEDDIPCAAVADPLDSHTVPTLKWWLLWHWIPSWCLRNARIHSCLLLGLLGKQCKGTEFSFARVLLHPNTSISRHFDTQHLYLKAFWHIHNLLQERRRHTIVTLCHVASLQLCLCFCKNTLIRIMY